MCRITCTDKFGIQKHDKDYCNQKHVFEKYGWMGKLAMVYWCGGTNWFDIANLAFVATVLFNRGSSISSYLARDLMQSCCQGILCRFSSENFLNRVKGSCINSFTGSHESLAQILLKPQTFPSKLPHMISCTVLAQGSCISPLRRALAEVLTGGLNWILRKFGMSWRSFQEFLHKSSHKVSSRTLSCSRIIQSSC